MHKYSYFGHLFFQYISESLDIKFSKIWYGVLKPKFPRDLSIESDTYPALIFGQNHIDRMLYLLTIVRRSGYLLYAKPPGK
jgi:hypothetical protein